MTGMLVLIAEDDATLAGLIASVARGKGFPVEAFDSASAILERLETVEEPCLVLADLALADGDGRRIVTSIRENQKLASTKVILLSGNRELAAIAQQSGAAGYLRKPFGLTELEELLRDGDPG